MKRSLLYAALGAVTLFVLSLPSFAHAKLRVVTTTQDPAALTRAIGGERVSVVSLAKGDQDPHFLDAKPSYIMELNKADLVASIGLDMEIGYLPALLTGARNPGILPGQPGHLDLSTVITPMDVKPTADRSQGDVHPSGNPHYWLAPENGRLMARAIAARLAQLDPDGKDAYAANLAAFERELDAKKEEWAVKLAPLRGKPIVTFHASWTYFVNAYGIEVIAYVEPKPGIPPTARHSVDVIRAMEARGAKIILMEVFYDARAASLITRKVPGAKVVRVANSVGGVDGVKTYIDLIDHVVSKLAAAAAGG